VLEKRLRESPGGAPYALGTSSPVTTISDSVVACAKAEWFEVRKIKPAQQIARIECAIAEKKSVFFIEPRHDYKIVINGKTNF